MEVIEGLKAMTINPRNGDFKLQPASEFSKLAAFDRT
jgi:hypothetical protein